MSSFITDKDVYEASKRIVTFKFGFREMCYKDKLFTILLFPLIYFLAIIGCICLRDSEQNEIALLYGKGVDK